MLAVLPAIGLGFLASHGFDVGFVTFAALLATSTLSRGYRQHRSRHVLLLVTPGFGLLLAGVWLDGHSLLHPLLMVLGGTLAAGAHVTNLRLLRRLRVEACSACSVG